MNYCFMICILILTPCRCVSGKICHVHWLCLTHHTDYVVLVQCYLRATLHNVTSSGTGIRYLTSFICVCASSGAWMCAV